MSRHTDPALLDLERQIAETREELGRTVEELAAKADVPARAKEKATQTAARTKARAAHVADRMKHCGGHGRHAAHDKRSGTAAGTAADTGTAAPGEPVTVSPAGGAHRIGTAASPAGRERERERMAYGAAALALAAATAGAATWAARRP